jgi:hypothetical protein
MPFANRSVVDDEDVVLVIEYSAAHGSSLLTTLGLPVILTGKLPGKPLCAVVCGVCVPRYGARLHVRPIGCAGSEGENPVVFPVTAKTRASGINRTMALFDDPLITVLANAFETAGARFRKVPSFCLTLDNQRWQFDPLREGALFAPVFEHSVIDPDLLQIKLARQTLVAWLKNESRDSTPVPEVRGTDQDLAALEALFAGGASPLGIRMGTKRNQT